MLKTSKLARAGFTLIEVVVAAAIMVALAAVTIPQVLDALDKKRIQDTYDLLLELHTGITNTALTGFINIVRTGVGTSTSTAPGRLSHLSEPILAASSTSFHNSCGPTATVTFAYDVDAVQAWTNGGPFIRRAIAVSTVLTQDGIRTPIGQMQNVITRTPAAPVGAMLTTVAHFIQLRINEVDPTDAAALDLLVDGIAGAATGTIRYTTAGSPAVATVHYLIPVPSRC